MFRQDVSRDSFHYFYRNNKYSLFQINSVCLICGYCTTNWLFFLTKFDHQSVNAHIVLQINWGQTSKSITDTVSQNIFLSCETANYMSHKLPHIIPGACSCSQILSWRQPRLYFVCLNPVRRRVTAHSQCNTVQAGVGISLKMQVVNENSGGGQIPTVYQGKAEQFLEMKSTSEVQCHILILFSIFYDKEELFPPVMFICSFPKTKQ